MPRGTGKSQVWPLIFHFLETSSRHSLGFQHPRRVGNKRSSLLDAILLHAMNSPSFSINEEFGPINSNLQAVETETRSTDDFDQLIVSSDASPAYGACLQ